MSWTASASTDSAHWHADIDAAVSEQVQGDDNREAQQVASALPILFGILEESGRLSLLYDVEFAREDDSISLRVAVVGDETAPPLEEAAPGTTPEEIAYHHAEEKKRLAALEEAGKI